MRAKKSNQAQQRKTIIKSLDQDKEFKEKLHKILDTEPLNKVIGVLENEIDSQLTETEFNYTLKGFRKDIAYHLNEAIKDVLTYSTISGNKGASGDTPPTFLTVDFPDGNVVKVPYGKINLPGLSPGSFIKMQYDTPNRTFHIRIVTQRRFANKIDEIIRKTKSRVKYNSIYANSALLFEEDNTEPMFIDVTKYRDTKVFLNPEVEAAFVPVEARIVKTEELQKKGIDIKTGVLLEGTYGSGKTLKAWQLASKAVDNGWTFIYVKDPNRVKEVMAITQEMAHSAKGSVLFVEDIDLLLSGDRDMEMNEIINMMDGGDNKNLNNIYIFTTNHIEKINPTFLRGKRIGALISMNYLNAETTEAMLKHFLADNLDVHEDLSEVVNMIVNNKIAPAFISEIIEKAKTNLTFYDKEFVSAGILKSYVESYLTQVRIVQKEREVPKEIVAWNMLKSLLGTDKVAELENVLEEIKGITQEIYDNI